MFSSFVDGKVISRWADREPQQQLFDNRLERERLYDTDEEDPRNRCYRKCTSLFESGTVAHYVAWDQEEVVPCTGKVAIKYNT